MTFFCVVYCIYFCFPTPIVTIHDRIPRSHCVYTLPHYIILLSSRSSLFLYSVHIMDQILHFRTKRSRRDRAVVSSIIHGYSHSVSGIRTRMLCSRPSTKKRKSKILYIQSDWNFMLHQFPHKILKFEKNILIIRFNVLTHLTRRYLLYLDQHRDVEKRGNNQ